MTSADSSQGHTQHQISLSVRVHVLYISIASLAIAQYYGGGGVDGGYMILHYSKISSPYTDYGS